MRKARSGKGGARRLYRLWVRNDQGCAEAILRGEDVEVVPSAYGQNDLFIEFLMGSGLWANLVGMRPDCLKKNNGKPWKALNGVEVIRELADVERLAHCGKVVSDARLMIIAGFNVEEVARAQARGKLVVDPETLANHLNRISGDSCRETFLQHIKILKRRRWIRGSVYAADAHEIIVPYGRKLEGLGRVNKKYGYKLVILLNLEPERERIVGYCLGPLQRNERVMLKEILKELHQRVAPLQRWIRTLVLDRGYWGARFLLGLKKQYGMEVVTRARDNGMDVVDEMERLTKGKSVGWREHQEERSRLGRIKVRCAGLEQLPLYDKGKRFAGYVNGVIADEFDKRGAPLMDEKGNPRPRMYYITTLPAAKYPYGIRRYYLRRWLIENQGFRELTQRWKIDTLAARRFQAINSRIGFTLMLYNAERILRMRHPGPWEEERKRLKRVGPRSLIGGPCLVAYTPEGALGVLSAEKYRRLVISADRRMVLAQLRQAARRGKSAEELLTVLENLPEDSSR